MPEKLLQLPLAAMISHVCLAQYYYIDSDLDSYIILSYPPIIGVCYNLVVIAIVPLVRYYYYLSISYYSTSLLYQVVV